MELAGNFGHVAGIIATHAATQCALRAALIAQNFSLKPPTQATLAKRARFYFASAAMLISDQDLSRILADARQQAPKKAFN